MADVSVEDETLRKARFVKRKNGGERARDRLRLRLHSVSV